MNLFKKIGKGIHKALTHNKCDGCGFTKDDVYHDGNYCSYCKTCEAEEEARETKKKNLNNS